VPTHEPELSEPYYGGEFYEIGYGVDNSGAVVQLLLHRGRRVLLRPGRARGYQVPAAGQPVRVVEADVQVRVIKPLLWRKMLNVSPLVDVAVTV
jgi:hypothetical protein